MIANIVHWNLTRQYGFKTTKKWYDHQIEAVLKNQKAKTLWYISLQTDHVVQARRPGIDHKVSRFNQRFEESNGIHL